MPFFFQQNTVLSDLGEPAQATITVYDAGTTNLSSIYEDVAGGSPKNNPFSTDAIGRYLFFASLGTYDIKVQGTGITTYTSYAVLVDGRNSRFPDASYFRPEMWGAVGDGNTDDGPAFRNMFADLHSISNSNYGQVRVNLSPAVYYKIESVYDSTSVFQIDIKNLIMEGPGMDLPTLKYEGEEARENFFLFVGSSDFVHLKEMQIVGSQTLIDYIIHWQDNADKIICRVDRVRAMEATTACFWGSCWMIEYRECATMNSAIGFGPGITSALYSHCFANSCEIGFYLRGNYSLLENCCCDHADIAYDIHTTGTDGQHHTLVECAAEDAVQGIVASSIDGGIIIMGGNWSGNRGNDPFFYFDDAHFYIIGAMTDNISNTYIVRFNSGGYSSGKEPLIIADIPNDRIYGYLDDSRSNPMRFRELGAGLNYHDFGAMTNFNSTLASISSTYLRKRFSIIQGSSGATFNEILQLKWVKGAGALVFAYNDLTSALTLNSSTTAGMMLEGIDVTVIFRKIYFKLSGASGFMFKIRDCKRIRFEQCKFETTATNSKLFDIDADSSIEMDKDTMDNLTTSESGAWAGLAEMDSWWHARRPIFSLTKYTDKPTAGVFDQGIEVLFDTPTAGGYRGAICISSGSPGTWKYFGLLES